MEYTQMSLFDFIEDSSTKQFSWDSDVNAIHEKLVALAEKLKISVAKEEWAVWSHVPNYGYRMTLTLRVTKEHLAGKLFDEMNNIIEFAKLKNVEISPTTPMFFGGEDTASIYIFSTFLDKERRKRKGA